MNGSYRFTRDAGASDAGVVNRGVITAADGGYVVTWSSYGQDGSEWGIYAQRYDAAGAVLACGQAGVRKVVTHVAIDGSRTGSTSAATSFRSRTRWLRWRLS